MNGGLGQKEEEREGQRREEGRSPPAKWLGRGARQRKRQRKLPQSQGETEAEGKGKTRHAVQGLARKETKKEEHHEGKNETNKQQETRAMREGQ